MRHAKSTGLHFPGNPLPTRRIHDRRRTMGRLIRVGGCLAVAATTFAILASSTPWPSAMVIRSVFERGGETTVAEMEQHVPDVELASYLDIEYGGEGEDTSLDVFRPATGAVPRATVVWIHGGAWISGQKSDVAPYLQILASNGYAAIGLNYTTGPEAVYPTAVTQLNGALDFIAAHAQAWGVDPERIVLAGDSAGAQLASQLAVLTTNPDYARLLGISPALSEEQLVGTILNCGVYDLERMADLSGVTAWGFKTALWAYTGTKDWSATYTGATMSTINFVTKDFPPTFISGGNGDGLTWIESVPMHRALTDAGVEVSALFWPAPHSPSLPHEYQFHLDLVEAQEALSATLIFLAHLP